MIVIIYVLMLKQKMRKNMKKTTKKKFLKTEDERAKRYELQSHYEIHV